MTRSGIIGGMGPNFDLEREAMAAGHAIVAGVDEVGRGPLAGPVTAAAVILDPRCIPEGLDDSKKLSAKRRQALHDEIARVAQVSVAHASVEEIDDLNILRASHLAMERALAGLALSPAMCLIDGNMIPRNLKLPARAVIKGDALSVSISAASIMAKICRDRVMWDLAQHWPGYGWDTNVGYASKSHKDAIRNLGVSPHHRRSFKPVHNILYQDNFISD